MNVTVYGTETCFWCKKAKEFLKQNKINYEYYDVAEDDSKREEMMEKSGQLGVPVLDINGTIIVGFDIEKIKKLLKL